MKLETIKTLADDEIRQIHQATLDILAESGVKVHNQPMLDFLAQKGLDVDQDSHVVHFGRSCIEDALAHIPTTFEVFNRQGQSAFVLGDGVTKIAAGHNAVFWVDSQTGETRPSRVADVELFSRICQQLEHIDMIGIPVMPQDVPDPTATLLYGVAAVIKNSDKPIFFSTDNARVNHGIIDMMSAAFAGSLKDQVYGICQLSPTSPLYWEQPVIEAIMDTVATGVPLAILPEPNAGVSAPYSLAGLLTMNNAECLSGLVMIQLLRPGTKVMYANSWTTTDMRSGAALVSSIETTVCRIAGAQLARFYGIPSHTTAPNSDNHAHDEQSAWERTFSTFCSVASGNDLIVNCGMFACGLTCSHEQLIMDNEIAAMSRRTAAGITVNRESIAAELIKQIGPQGETYLTADHTLDRLHGDEFYEPGLAVRGPRAAWEATGSKDTYQIARDKVRDYADSTAGGLDAARAAKLAEIIDAFGT